MVKFVSCCEVVSFFVWRKILSDLGRKPYWARWQSRLIQKRISPTMAWQDLLLLSWNELGIAKNPERTLLEAKNHYHISKKSTKKLWQMMVYFRFLQWYLMCQFYSTVSPRIACICVQKIHITIRNLAICIYSSMQVKTSNYCEESH